MLSRILEVPGFRMKCPLCKGNDARRSRRQNAADYLLSVLGVYPWRCRDCRARFYARLMPLSDSLRAHCPICGNLDLKRISPQHVDTHLGFLWSSARIPAYRCEPCRHKYFSILPQRPSQLAEASFTD
jgi:C4-type Zn-finger protein